MLAGSGCAYIRAYLTHKLGWQNFRSLEHLLLRPVKILSPTLSTLAAWLARAKTRVPVYLLPSTSTSTFTLCAHLGSASLAPSPFFTSFPSFLPSATLGQLSGAHYVIFVLPTPIARPIYSSSLSLSLLPTGSFVPPLQHRRLSNGRALVYLQIGGSA